MGDLLSLAERQEVDPVKQERMEVRGRSSVQTVAVDVVDVFRAKFWIKLFISVLWILSVWTVRPGTWTRVSTLSSAKVGSSALVRFFFFF